MLKSITCAAALAATLLAASSALAHAGPNILQLGGSKAARVAMSGVQHSTENGVGIYRGRKTLLDDKPAPNPQHKNIEIEIVACTATCHPPARLRTQGLYSGRGHSYPFTQGFYSGQRTMRR